MPTEKTTCSVFIANSLDGFIAKPDGDIDWLHHPDYTIEGEDFGYTRFMESIDAIIMGRNSFEKVLSFDGWHYDKPVLVLSSSLKSVPEAVSDKAEILNGSPEEVLSKLASKGLHHFYIDGGKTIQNFLNAGLIDEMIITKIPVLLGEGIPLFGPLEKDLQLKLIGSESFDNGFVQLTYKPQYHSK
jgi:dihydrofolate reductase